MASETLRGVARYAEDQWGLVTRRQVEATGLSKATRTRLIKRGDLERVAHGVYHLRGAPLPDLAELRAAWLQLAPEVPAWKRTVSQGVVSHRSAAVVFSLGHLPADTHDFTIPTRRQTRRRDVRLHLRELADGEWMVHRGLKVTRPSRIAADLLLDHEEPSAVAQLIADSVRPAYDRPAAFAGALAPLASRFGLRRDDGLALLRWLLELIGDPDTDRWVGQAQHAEAPDDEETVWRASGPGEAAVGT